jgi:hypothetical protein
MWGLFRVTFCTRPHIKIPAHNFWTSKTPSSLRFHADRLETWQTWRQTWIYSTRTLLKAAFVCTFVSSDWGFRCWIYLEHQCLFCIVTVHIGLTNSEVIWHLFRLYGAACTRCRIAASFAAPYSPSGTVARYSRCILLKDFLRAEMEGIIERDITLKHSKFWITYINNGGSTWSVIVKLGTNSMYLEVSNFSFPPTTLCSAYRMHLWV